MAYPRWPVISIAVSVVSLALLVALFRTRLRALDVFSALLLFGAAVLTVLIVLYTRSLRHAQQVQFDTEDLIVVKGPAEQEDTDGLQTDRFEGGAGN
jgi:phosphoglycerol transferase MdoB-like AlkP superfamily enzyme